MKADRRKPPTKESPKIIAPPENFFQQYGTRILVAIIFALLAYILVRNHLASKDQKAKESAEGLGTAIYGLNELKTLSFSSSSADLARARKDKVKDIEDAIDAVLTNTEDPKYRAEALVVKGDLNWWQANFPAPPGSDTRPELLLGKSSDKYLQEAESAYNEVLAPPLDGDHPSVIAARLSLAKIAENRRQWDKANQFYDRVINDSSATKGAQEYARLQKDNLKKISTPIYTGTPDTSPFSPFNEPATEPATTESTTAPSTTQPAASQATTPPSTTQSASTEPSVLPSGSAH